MKKKRLRNIVIIWCVMLGAIMWFGVKLSMAYRVGISIPEFEMAFKETLKHPFLLRIAEHTAAFCIVFFIIWIVMLSYYFITYGNYRRGEEHGKAELANLYDIRRRYAQDQSMIVSQNVRIGMDAYKIKANSNVNTLIVGAPGSGKTQYLVLPNALEFNCNYIFTDTKGELLKSLGNALLQAGYTIKVLNIKDMNGSLTNSHKYNAFEYARNATDINKLITNLVANTTPKDAAKGEAFWEKGEIQLLEAIMCYVWSELPSYERNFDSVSRLLLEIQIDEENGQGAQNVVDELFEELEKKQPRHPAVLHYKGFRQTAGRTALGFLKGATSRLKDFIHDALCRLTAEDELEFHRFTTNEKMALFVITSDTDPTYNFLAGIAFTQLINILQDTADSLPTGRLPRHVAFYLDEFANTAQINHFDRVLSTCRGRNISMKIVIQTFAQLKWLYKDLWEGIAGSCGIQIYLGSAEQAAHEYFSKAAGKSTINYSSLQKDSHKVSTNINITGRDAVMQDEVRRLPWDECMVFLYGEQYIQDKKFDLLKHKNFKMIPRGGVVQPYIFDRNIEVVYEQQEYYQ